MGTHGHSKWGEAIIGSITNEVMRRSPVPVMAVRLPPEAAPGNKITFHNDQDRVLDGFSSPKKVKSL